MIICISASSGDESDLPLFRYEITDRTVVKLHEEYYFLPSTKSKAVKRDSSGRPVTKESASADDRLRFSFYVNRMDTNDKMTFLEFSTPVEIAQLSWKQHIELTRYEYKRNLETGVDGEIDANRLTDWKVNFESLSHSYNVSTLLAMKGTVKLKSTALCERRGDIFCMLHFVGSFMQ